jgi:hypothetical protein
VLYKRLVIPSSVNAFNVNLSSKVDIKQNLSFFQAIDKMINLGSFLLLLIVYAAKSSLPTLLTDKSWLFFLLQLIIYAATSSLPNLLHVYHTKS